MSVRVLIVDDSGFFRRRLSEMLTVAGEIEVVGMAADGKEAIRKTLELQPDVITMDMEMPVLDGVAAVRRIMSSRPTPILMFSALTTKGAQATLDALEAGAADYLPKDFAEISQDRDEVCRQLRVRVQALSTHADPCMPVIKARHRILKQKIDNLKLIVIGASTGGPMALQQVLSKLPAGFPLPLMIVQHMPATFTPTFARRLDQLCAIHVKEAVDGEALRAGTAYLAPGGYQTLVTKKRSGVSLCVRPGGAKESYRPSVDIAFQSAAEVFPGQALGLVLTGMGTDGREGARALKQTGCPIWVQDEASCVVYGMPMAVAEAGLADQVITPAEMGSGLVMGV